MATLGGHGPSTLVQLRIHVFEELDCTASCTLSFLQVLRIALVYVRHTNSRSKRLTGSRRAPFVVDPQVLRQVKTIADLSELSEEQLQPMLGAGNASKLHKFFRQPAPL